MDRAPGELRELARRVTADRRRALRRIVACALSAIVVALLWAWQREHVRAYARGEIDLSGEPRYAPHYPVDRRALARIDLERVHAELIPAWTIALGRASTQNRRRLADLAFIDLAREVAPDRNLSALLESTHRALREDPIEHARRLDYLLWAYNRYLEEQHLPWRLEASLALGEHGAIFRALSYEIMADARNDEGHRLRLMRRADRTNAMEGWLGHTGSRSGALVLLQRVLHFTVRHVWPGLHPALDERRPAAERSWLGYVRDEVRAGLDPQSFALLVESAADQQTLIEVAEAVHARGECGSRFRIRELPYNGLSMRGRHALELALARSRDETECPEIRLDEAARIVGASERLASSEGLDDAVERLAMLVARSVAVHELQHAEDGEDLACHGCPEGLTGIARAEVSAYLGTFSQEGLGYIALLQACASPRGAGVHGAALQAVLDAMLPYGCEGPTLHGLYELAERIETRLFGKRGDVTLPVLPARVALLPLADRRERTRPRWRPLESGWGVAVVREASAPQGRESRAESALVP